MELFVKLVNGIKLLTIFTKSSVLDIWMGSKYTFVFWKYWKVKKFITLNWTCESKTWTMYFTLITFWEVVVRRCSVKKVFLEISQNPQENTRARVSFLIKLQASGLQLD